MRMMMINTGNLAAAALLIALLAAPMPGCDSLPGSRTEQATVGGAAAGAVLGAVIAENNRLIGALIGGVLGAGGGYLIGAKTDWFEDDDDKVRDEARASVDEAHSNPASAAEARRADTADINSDGFVTLDEVIAMKEAGFSDREMIRRLEATGQIFDLNEDQRQILLDNGVSRNVVRRMQEINQEARDRYLADADDDAVISREP